MSVGVGDVNADADDLFLFAYDLFDNLIDSYTTSIADSFVGFETLTVSGANIAYVVFGGGNQSIRTRFTPTTSPTRRPPFLFRPVACSFSGRLAWALAGVAAPETNHMTIARPRLSRARFFIASCRNAAN